METRADAVLARAVIGAEHGPQRIERAGVGGVRGWKGSAAVSCSLRSLRTSPGAPTPGSEAGSAGRGGPECDLIVGNNATLRNRVETEARAGEGPGGDETAA